MKRIFARLSNPLKLTLCVVSLIGTELLLLRLGGLVASTQDTQMDERARLCEAVAINFSLLAIREDIDTMRRTMHMIQTRNDTIESIGVRRTGGELLIDVGRHAQTWVQPDNDKSTLTHMIIPISSQNGRWGTIEMRFSAGQLAWLPAFLQDDFLKLFVAFNTLSLPLFYFFFRKVLTQLNPAKAIPGRVRSALDTLTEGLLILDSSKLIVLANESFSRLVGRSSDRIIGMHPSELPWRQRANEDDGTIPETPWDHTMRTGNSVTGQLFDFEVSPDRWRTLVVNASPVFDPNGKTQGVLVSLGDVTPLEQKKRELNSTLLQLRERSDEIRRQNEELEKLATTDPLTECLNRRSFFKQVEGLWSTAQRHKLPISAIMVDIDFFKSINDEHGHSVGDEVLRGVAATLRETARVGDLVCRFGGEEFCVLLPHTDIDAAAQAGERFRSAIAATRFPNLSVTASIGVSSRSLGANDLQSVIDQADKCLYVAKRNGRNQVVRFDNVPADLEVDESKISRTKPGAEAVADVSPPDHPDDTSSVPYRAVAALLSTLAYRHAESAAHSRRVADLCVSVAEGLMSPREIYSLEIAALLHDIGKMGVPDAVLLKSGPLTADEWELMRRHDRIGVEIVRAAFDCQPVTDIVASYRLHFSGGLHRTGVLAGGSIPQGARILSVADAWDSMTTDRPYRKALSVNDASTEIRRCAGSQFDPHVVERFLSVIASQSHRTEQRQARTGQPTISREAALGIGQSIERLADALESQDLEGMTSLADRLEAIARQDGLDDFATMAADLKQSIVSDADLLDVLSTAHQLIDLCRSTHATWLNVDRVNT